jgi:hypothetical protein
MKKINLIGHRFGRLTVIDEAPSLFRYGRKFAMWLCKCDCGQSKIIYYSSVAQGLTKSCGCLRSELSGDRGRKQLTTHGMTKSREFNSWRNMRDRCYNKHNKDYKNYGGRGITVCEEWNNSFEKFFSDMGKRPIGKTLDRINNNGNYEPLNCKWSTHLDQIRNRRAYASNN